MLTRNVEMTFHSLLREWSEERRVFDALAVRDELRQRHPRTNIAYGEVFPEIWHAFRKGELDCYIVRTKVVSVVDGTEQTTVEYVPAELAVLARVRGRWVSADVAARYRAADIKAGMVPAEEPAA